MKAIHRERLLQVCRVLRELPKGKRFSLYGWYECGTIGCAIGWAAADPWFKRRGLKLRRSIELGYEKNWYPVCSELVKGEAVSKFFNLTISERHNLFYPGGYTRDNRRDVIRRIEKFVADA